MIERITYGERKTHKLTFLFLFFYCHFYFAVTLLLFYYNFFIKKYWLFIVYIYLPIDIYLFSRKLWKKYHTIERILLRKKILWLIKILWLTKFLRIREKNWKIRFTTLLFDWLLHDVIVLIPHKTITQDTLTFNILNTKSLNEQTLQSIFSGQRKNSWRL